MSEPKRIRVDGGAPEKCFCTSGEDWVHETVWADDGKSGLAVLRGCGVGDCRYAEKQYRVLIHLTELEEFPYQL